MNKSNIHYRYAISYLVFFIILLFALRYYDVPDLVDKFSFALTLSSLLLAILAISYTIVFAHKQDNQFSRLIETNSDLKAAAKEIQTASGNINTVLSDLPLHFKEMGSKIDSLADQYSALSTESLDSKDEKDKYSREIELKISEEDVRIMIGNLYFSSMAVLYLFSQACFKGQNIDICSFNDLELNSSEYVFGFLNGFKMTGLIDFKIHKNALIPVRCC